MIVVDASALVEVLLRTPAAGAVQRQLFDAQETLHAPYLVDVEVAQALRLYGAIGALDPELGRQALVELADLPMRRYPHNFLLPRVWELRNNLTAYDAVYVALAEALDAPLLTRDRRLPNAARHEARVAIVSLGAFPA